MSTFDMMDAGDLFVLHSVSASKSPLDGYFSIFVSHLKDDTKSIVCVFLGRTDKAHWFYTAEFGPVWRYRNVNEEAKMSIVVKINEA